MLNVPRNAGAKETASRVRIPSKAKPCDEGTRGNSNEVEIEYAARYSSLLWGFFSGRQARFGIPRFNRIATIRHDVGSLTENMFIPFIGKPSTMRSYQELLSSALIAALSCFSACAPIDDRDPQVEGAVGTTNEQPARPQLVDGGSAVNVSPIETCGEDCVEVDPLSSEPPSNSTAAVGATVDAGAPPVPACPGCIIDGTCVAAGALENANACGICDPLRDANAWSANDQVVCDDGLFCTTDDACQAGACSGQLRVCDDGVACNGVSICLEATDSCSASTNECGANGFCDVTTANCVSTCTGCLVDGVCVQANAEKPGDPCLTCQPSVSSTTYMPAVGKSCGAARTECSGQDTCDSQARCQPNHVPATTACGSSSSTACDRPDACDGNGNCDQRGSTNGTACNDGLFCSVGDRCQGGRCVPNANLDCGANRVCNEGTDQCQCQGCQVRADCVFDGDTNPANPCQICDVSRSQTAFSANVGNSCGSGASECSAQDTCDARGQCAPNDRGDGTTCSGQAGFCRGGQCVSRQQTGTDCTMAAQCLSGFCRGWFIDVDTDRHGDPARSRMLCSLSPDQDEVRSDGSGLLIPVFNVGTEVFVGLGDDCCDSTGFGGNLMFPGKVSPVSGVLQTACPNRLPRDFDCDGVEFCFAGNPPPCL